LVSIPRVLLCVEDFFLLGKFFPVFLYKLRLSSPLFTDDFGDVGIDEPRILRHDLGLVVLTI